MEPQSIRWLEVMLLYNNVAQLRQFVGDLGFCGKPMAKLLAIREFRRAHLL